MDKTAQKRSLLNKLHELANVPARSAESFFKPQLKEIMMTLVQTDDGVRANLKGQKELLKEAKSFFNRREYLSAMANLGRFHKTVVDVAKVLEALKLNVDSIHHRFLFEKLPGKHRSELEDLHTRLASNQTQLIVEAGIADFFHNIGTQRGRALSMWEKRYPKVVGKIRDGIENQIAISLGLWDEILSLLKVMASNRASRNIDAYLDNAQKIVAIVNKYNNGFKKFYNDVIRPYMDAQVKIEADEAAKSAVKLPPTTPAASQIGDFGHVTIPIPKDDDGNLPTPVIPVPPTPISVSPPITEPAPTPIPTVPSLPAPGESSKSEQVHKEILKQWEEKNKNKNATYNSFIESLEVFSNEEPELLSAHISKYARSILNDDPDIAIKLLKIAKTLRG